MYSLDISREREGGRDESRGRDEEEVGGGGEEVGGGESSLIGTGFWD
jgi:hypothetical protein